MWPRIVADALDEALSPPPMRGGNVHCDAERWQGAVRQAWQPAEHEGPPPGWLRPHQVVPWRRSVAALQRHGGVVLAEPVGTGKTWIALAAIRTCGGFGTVVAPAVLIPQWQAAAAGLPLRMRWHSLERCSRGVPPPDTGGLAVVDEAHRLRHLGTRRARTLTEWLGRHRALLLTATPIVNRRTDLIALLQLVIGDDALRHDGIPSLEALATADTPHPAVRRVVVRTMSDGGGTPLATRRFPLTPGEGDRAARAADGIATLRLATAPGTRRLLHGVLADAAASSDAAWHAALQRSDALLRQARDAGGLSRSLLRRFAGPACDQGVFWELVAPEAQDTPAIMPTDDLPRIQALRTVAPADAHWLAALERILHDDAVTVLFCRHHATAHLIRHHLGTTVAWVTGHEAGLGPHRLPRHQVLTAFGPGRAAWQVRRHPPTVLIATDVAAEGLDLQAAARVIHVDLPWTAMRRDQRNGRLRRPGQEAGVVEVIERHPPPALERLLRLGWRIRTKGAVAARWLDALQHGADQTASAMRHRGAWQNADRLWLVRIVEGDAPTGTMLVASNGQGAWVPSAADVARLLARGGDPSGAICSGEQPTTGHEILAAAHQALALPSQFPAMTARIQRLARTVGHRRDLAGLRALDALLGHLHAPGPLGMRRELERLRHAPDAELLAHQLPKREARTAPVARVLAATVVPADRSPLGSRHDALLDRPL